LDIFEIIEQKNNKASKWDLLKVVGTQAQFHFWVEDFLLKDKFITINEIKDHLLFSKTENGEFLHELLKNGKLMKALLKVSGKRLRKNI
jgi:hypothetical protein